MTVSTVFDDVRVAIVAENASARFGGECSLPLQYFSRLRRRGIDARLIVNGRNRAELTELFPGDTARLLFVTERWFHVLIWHIGRLLPRRLSDAIRGSLLSLIDQFNQRRILKALIADNKVNIVHQPTPVSPRSASFLFGLGIPVIIGPMNGGMEYPPAFRVGESVLTRLLFSAARSGSRLVNRILPGKQNADVLLVANTRTRRSLPPVRGRIIKLVENGVDLTIWSSACPDRQSIRSGHNGCRFVFIGRLVDWKRLDLAIHALARVEGAILEVIGDGAMRSAWSQLAQNLGIADRVQFVGWLSQPDCAARIKGATALLLPSIYECGGAVVLEAMAVGTPVIATAWGGPLDYIDNNCGILIDPSSAEGMIAGFADAMGRLANDPELGALLAERAKLRVRQLYDWEGKIDRILTIYNEQLERRKSVSKCIN